MPRARSLAKCRGLILIYALPSFVSMYSPEEFGFWFSVLFIWIAPCPRRSLLKMFSSYAWRSRARWNSLWRVRRIEGLRTKRKTPPNKPLAGVLCEAFCAGSEASRTKAGRDYDTLCRVDFNRRLFSSPYQRRIVFALIVRSFKWENFFFQTHSEAGTCFMRFSGAASSTS